MTFSPVKIRAGKYAGIYLAVILFVISFGLGFLTGQTFFVKKQITNQDGELDILRTVNFNREINRSDSIEFDRFWEIWDKIKTKYVKTDVSEEDMFYGAVQGLVYSLGDPYSLFFTPSVAEEFAKDLSGELEGIGAEIGVKNNQVLVISPLPDTPAEKAGLRAGDKIVKIDDELTIGMDVTTAVSKIRGEAGTTVTLTIDRDDGDGIREIAIVRAQIDVPSILFEWRGDKIAYFRVLQFNDDAESLFNKYVKKATSGGAKGIILDMRNNPGGFLEAAISMASEWVDDGVIVVEKSRGAAEKKHASSGDHRLVGIPTVVLVNSGSASASEIVAGALQDYGLATIIGTQTFGKGSVQDFEVFDDGSALKMTVAEWYTPNGNNINEQGIAPDIIVEEDWDNDAVGVDKVMDKAEEVFKDSKI